MCAVKGKALLKALYAALQEPTIFAPNVAVRFDYSQVTATGTEFVSLYYSDRFTTTPSNPVANLKQTFGVSALSDSQSPMNRFLLRGSDGMHYMSHALRPLKARPFSFVANLKQTFGVL